MSKALIMYSSKYGTTKQYAEWIAAELNGDIVDVGNVNRNNLKNYDTIVLGSGLYAGNIKGINHIINNFEDVKNKKLVLFTCGLADYSKSHNIEAVSKRLEKIIPANVREKITIFYLRGGIDYKKLSLMHKIMMGMLNKIIKRKDAARMDDEDKEFIEAYGKTVDFTDKNNIGEIIKFCK